jgi:hypothetical protein
MSDSLETTIKPGARVRAKQALWQDLCAKGDVLIVRRLSMGCAFRWLVSHPHRDPNGPTFAVNEDEIQLIEEVAA